MEPLDALPIPAFDLTDFDAYEKLSGARKIGYATSVGCPYACNYCTDMVFYKRRFNALSAERVVSRAHRPGDQISDRRSGPARLKLPRPA